MEIKNIIILIIIIIIVTYFLRKLLIDNFINIDQGTQTNEDEHYTAVIIEPRHHPALELVLKNFTSNLDERWNFILFHGGNNKDFVMNILENKIPEHKHRFTLVNLHVENLSIYDYNSIFYNQDFYNFIPTEMFLVFQVDTFICKKFKNNIYKFMHYDYVGAPWYPAVFNKDNCSNNNVGNGGLSLRRKSKMLEILKNCNYENINEDFLFSKTVCDCNYDIEVNKPSVDEAKKFSIEHMYSPNAFGIHKAWRYVSEDLSYCEGLDELAAIHNYQ